MKHFLICDFSTITCDREMVAEVLTSHNIPFINHNNFCWELNIPNDFLTPFSDSESEELYALLVKYCKKDSLLLIVKADEYCSHPHQ